MVSFTEAASILWNTPTISNKEGLKMIDCFQINHETNLMYVYVVVYPLPWPLLVGGSPMFPLVVHQPAFSVHLASSVVTPAGVCVPHIQG